MAALKPVTPIPATRVDASQHSQIYFNAFSIDASSVIVIDKITPVPDGENGAFRQRIELERETKTVLVGTGFTFEEITAVLAPEGWILQGAPAAESISLGGAIATSAHGAGLGSQPLSAYLLDLWITNAHDEEVHVNKFDPEFPAAVVSLGLLGPITQVRMQCFVPKKNRKTTSTTTRTYSGAELITDASADTTVSFQYAMYKKRMVRYDETLTDEPASTSGCCDLTAKVAESQCLLCTFDESIRCFPWLAYITSQASVVPSTTVVNRLDFVSPIPSVPVYQLEYAVDIVDAAACFEELTVTIDSNRKEGRLITYQFQSRFIGAVNESWALALSAGADKITFEITFSTNQKGALTFFDALAEVLKKYNGRPHLGKTIRPSDVTYAAQVYGRTAGGGPYLAFEAIRKRFDPEGVFLNASLREFVTTAKEEAIRAAKSAATA